MREHNRHIYSSRNHSLIFRLKSVVSLQSRYPTARVSSFMGDPSGSPLIYQYSTGHWWLKEFRIHGGTDAVWIRKESRSSSDPICAPRVQSGASHGEHEEVPKAQHEKTKWKGARITNSMWSSTSTGQSSAPNKYSTLNRQKRWKINSKGSGQDFGPPKKRRTSVL